MKEEGIFCFRNTCDRHVYV